MKFYPDKKREGRTILCHAEGGGGGGTNSFDVVLTLELEVLAILIREAKTPFKMWGAESFPLS